MAKAVLQSKRSGKKSGVSSEAVLPKPVRNRLNALPKTGLKGSKKLSEILGVKPLEDFVEPKKLSKYGEWAKAHPKGLEIEYIDWRAVLK